jgi:hypothetical protein
VQDGTENARMQKSVPQHCGVVIGQIVEKTFGFQNPPTDIKAANHTILPLLSCGLKVQNPD